MIQPPYPWPDPQPNTSRAQPRHRFSVCLIEPSGFRHMQCWYDICRYLCFGLEALGHDCIIQRGAFATDRTNLLVDFYGNTDPSLVTAIRQAGPYILLMTELVAPCGIPGLTDCALNPNRDTTARDIAVFRNVHLPLMRHAAGVWTGTASNLVHLAALGIDAQLLPGGYLPEMQEVCPKDHRDIDFLFYGSPLPHRVQLLDQLAARGGRVVRADQYLPHVYRNDLIARTRVHLVPHRGTAVDFAWAKTCYLCNQRALVVVERSRDQERYQDAFITADTEHWTEICLDTLHRPDRVQIADACFRRFQALRFDASLAPLVDRFLSRPIP